MKLKKKFEKKIKKNLKKKKDDFIKFLLSIQFDTRSIFFKKMKDFQEYKGKKIIKKNEK